MPLSKHCIWVSPSLANPCGSVPPAVANGVVSGCQNYASGTSCVPMCNSGYYAVSSYTCSLGTWTGSPTCSGRSGQSDHERLTWRVTAKILYHDHL